MSTTSDDSLPDVPGFTIEELVGEGAFGRVYKAIQNSIKRPVALKVGKAVPGIDGSLEREVHRLSRLRHPNIVPVFDAGFAPRNERWIPYLAMELIDAGSLEATFGEVRKSQTLRSNLENFIELLRALQHSHDLGITHADLHEENLLLARDGNRYYVKIADFGFPSHMKSANVADRTAEDVEQLRLLFWKYFYFPRIEGFMEPDDFNGLDLAGMLGFVDDMSRFRLSDSMFDHDEDKIGVSEIEERESRLSRIAFAYALDHPMRKNVALRVQPWLGADISVERGDEVDTFLFWPGVSTQACAYVFLLWSLSDVSRVDYDLAPGNGVQVSSTTDLEDVCHSFARQFRLLAYFGDFDRRGYLLPTITSSIRTTFDRCVLSHTHVEGAIKFALFNGILRRFHQEELPVPAQIEQSTRETLSGLAYIIARLPWEQLRSPAVAQRLLQVFLDRLMDQPYAVGLDGHALSISPVHQLKARGLQICVETHAREQAPQAAWDEKGHQLQLTLTLGWESLAQLSALLHIEKNLRMPASQYFECGNISILARYAHGLYYRIGDAWFTFGGNNSEYLYSQFDSAVSQAASALPPNMVALSKETAKATLLAQRASLDRYTVICPGTFEDRDYRDELHPVVASYGMVIHALGKSKAEALKSLDNGWFARANEEIAE